MDEFDVKIYGDKILSRANSVTLLGLDIDDKLCFNQHIDEVCQNLSKCIVVLRKIRNNVPLSQRVLCYNAIVWQFLTMLVYDGEPVLRSVQSSV